MSRLEPSDTIEAIVGAQRHATDHLGRAVSAQRRVYVLHSDECRARGLDLRKCEYSIALDYDIEVWCPCCSRWRRLDGDVHATIAWRTGLSRRARLVQES